jgi:hypothetical protein
MNPRAFRILIAVMLILFVILTILFQNICAPDKNPVSAAVSSVVEKTFTEQFTSKPVDLLSYDGLKKAVTRWLTQYCQRQ